MMTLIFIKKWWFLLFYLLIYFLAINAVVLNRFWQFETFYFDHGIFDSSLWQVAHGLLPIIDHLENGFISQFGDHFTPTLYLLAPLYLLTSKYEPILIIGNLFVVASAFVIFLIAQAKIKSRFLVFAIIFAYTLFIGLQNTIIANLHTELITLLTLSLTLLCLEKGKWRWYWLFLILTLGTKQNFAAIGIGLGIYLFFINKKISLVTIVFSLAYYFLITKIIIPNYLYSPAFNFSWNSTKTETVFTSLATFGFLPLGAITFLPAIFQDFITRFFFTSAARWDLGLHYNATLSVLLVYSSILTASKFNKRVSILLAVLIIFSTLYFHRFKYHGALGLSYNSDFYRHTAQMDFLRNFLRQIPPNKTVMTLNNLAPYLTHTNAVMLLRGNYQDFSPDVIALDTRPGQNPANFWPTNYETLRNLPILISTDSAYNLRRVSDTLYIFIRK